jgi:hypothetical protein
MSLIGSKKLRLILISGLLSKCTLKYYSGSGSELNQSSRVVLTTISPCLVLAFCVQYSILQGS